MTSLRPPRSAALDQVVPFHWKTLLPPVITPVATQDVVVAQLTADRASCDTVAAADHVVPLKLNASPAESTTMQNEGEGQLTALSE